MNKEEFLQELGSLLSDIPEKDREDAIKYYSDYIDDAGEEAEHAIAELGSPESIARIVKSESADALEPKPIENPPMEQPEYTNAPSTEPLQGDKAKKRLPAWAIVVLTVLSPVILLLAIVLMLVVLAVVIVSVGVVLAVTALFLILAYLGGLSLTAGCFMILEGCFSAGLVSLGAGLMFLAAGLVVLIATGFGFVKFLPWLFRVLFSSKKKRLARKEEKKHLKEEKKASKQETVQPETTFNVQPEEAAFGEKPAEPVIPEEPVNCVVQEIPQERTQTCTGPEPEPQITADEPETLNKEQGEE